MGYNCVYTHFYEHISLYAFLYITIYLYIYTGTYLYDRIKHRIGYVATIWYCLSIRDTPGWIQKMRLETMGWKGVPQFWDTIWVGYGSSEIWLSKLLQHVAQTSKPSSIDRGLVTAYVSYVKVSWVRMKVWHSCSGGGFLMFSSLSSLHDDHRFWSLRRPQQPLDTLRQILQYNAGRGVV